MDEYIGHFSLKMSSELKLKAYKLSQKVTKPKCIISISYGMKKYDIIIN